jgi:tetratricopeptide (TPR) repeat protein/transcriptional regulator with XRE-family HTH domain
VGDRPAAFGELVRRVRVASKLTQEALAERTGLSVRAVSDIERGRTTSPHRASVLRIAEVLGLDQSELAELTAPGSQPDRDSRPAVARQLPAGTAPFVGRAAEIDALTRLLPHRDAMPGTVAIAAITGTAGLGKTTLALHWAHLVADAFPDGQLYVNLRGFDPSGEPVTPTAAIRGFLDALQIPRDRLPVSTVAQAGLYQSLAAGRRMLIILDNARDAAQVRPLLPASPTCLVLVTSRNQMTDLVTAEGAHPLALDLLADSEAGELLALRLGARRLAAEGDAARQLSQLCARLPLALSIAAARAVTHPHFPLASLVSELEDTRRRLDALDWGEGTSLRAVFSWSYQQLGALAARVFRLLGAHPGPDITVPAAASLAEVGLPAAREALAELHRANLLSEPAPGRFTFHDLLRAYAGELTASHDGEAEQNAAQSRLLGYYLPAAAEAIGVLFRAEPERPLSFPPPAIAVPALSDPAAARAWLDAELANLIATTVYAADHREPRQAIAMAATLSRYLRATSHHEEAIALHSRCRRAARDIGDRCAEAAELTSLGDAEALQGHHQQAADYHQRALVLSRQAGDPIGEARVLNSLGVVEFDLCRYQRAARHWRQSLARCRSAGQRHGLVITLGNLGLVELRLGRRQQASRYLREALAISAPAEHDPGVTPDSFGHAHVLEGLGQVELALGHHQQASGYLQQALALSRQVNYRRVEANACHSLALAELALRHYPQAREYVHQALAIVREIGYVPGEAQAVNTLGQVLLAVGDHVQARAQHQQALTLASHDSAPYEQARAHNGLGHACQAAGDHAQAREHWRQALDLYSWFGVPEADTVRGLLTAGDVASG